MAGINKKILDSKWAWDIFQSPIYNRVVAPTAEVIVSELIDTINIPNTEFKGLDIGCGSGLATFMFAKKWTNASFIGVDYSSLQIRAARKNLSKRQLQNCSFDVGNAMNLSYDDDTFDIVCSVASIKHWPDGTTGLSEILRVLKAGGKAFIGEVEREYDQQDMDRFCNSLNYFRFIRKDKFESFMKKTVFGHSISPAEAEAMAREAGFTDINVGKVASWPVFKMELTKI